MKDPIQKSKDPAFLFYSQDFITGTQFFTDEQVGKYIRLLCAQHSHGHLSEKHMLSICKAYDEDVLSKFLKDKDGKYYNERLENEMIKRKLYTDSRRNNAKHPKTKKAYANHMDDHMENENINDNNKELLEFKKFEEWIEKNAPNVAKMKEPFLIDQYKQVKENFKSEQVKAVLKDMHNYKPLLTKNISAYLTLSNWIKKRGDETPVKKLHSTEPSPLATLKKLGA